MSAWTPGFEHDVFISYAHIDNANSGWVEMLHRDLSARLAEVLGARVDIWRDSHKLDGLDFIHGVIEKDVSHSAMFLAIVSPSYIGSEYCQRELAWFLEQTRSVRVENKSRVARVRKMALPPGVEENELLAPAETLGFPFFDETNPSIEFDNLLHSTTAAAYRDQVKKLAGAIARVLCDLKEHARSPKRTVFLAHPATKLSRIWKTLKEDLEAQGHEVVPEQMPLREGALDQERLHAALDRATYAVHIFGESYGVIPDGRERSLPEEQYVRAAAAKLPQIVWIEPDCTQETKQRDFLAQVRLEVAATQSDERRVDLCESGLAEFREALGDILNAPPTGSQHQEPDSVASKIYLLFHKADMMSADLRALRCALLNSGFPVDLPAFEAQDDELRKLEQERITNSDATIIYYGVARDIWVEQKRKFLIKSLAGSNRWRALYLSLPKTDLKEFSFGSYLGGSLLEERGLSPLLVLGDFGPFRHESLSPLFENLGRDLARTLVPESKRPRGDANESMPPSRPPSQPVTLPKETGP